MLKTVSCPRCGWTFQVGVTAAHADLVCPSCVAQADWVEPSARQVIAATRRSFHSSRLWLGVLVTTLSVFGLLSLAWFLAELSRAVGNVWVADLILFAIGLALASRDVRPGHGSDDAPSIAGPLPALVYVVVLRHLLFLGESPVFGLLLLVFAGLMLAAGAAARVDQAALRGRRGPTWGQAMGEAWAGFIPGLLPALSLVILAWLLVGLFEPWLGQLASSVPVLPVLLGILFLVVNVPVVLFLPVAIWLAISIGASVDRPPGGVLSETLTRIRREPFRLLVQCAALTSVATLVFGLPAVLLTFAVDVTADSTLGFGLVDTLNSVLGLVKPGPAAFLARAWVVLVVGGIVALLLGVFVGPLLGVVFSGASEIVLSPAPLPPSSERPAPEAPASDHDASWWR